MVQQVRFVNQQRESLSGILHIPARPADRGIVIGHCFTCSRNTLILQQIGQDLADAGCHALRFDFSGNGRSQGDFAESIYSKQIAEMEAAIDFLLERGCTRIGLAGHSMGAAIAILTAARSPAVKSVCAIAGRLSGTRAAHFLNARQLRRLEQKGRTSFVSRGRELEITQNFFDDAARHDLPGRIAALKTPLLVVHGDRDEIVPVDEAFAAHKLNPSVIELAIIPGADHMFSDPAYRLQAAGQVVDWFVRR